MPESLKPDEVSSADISQSPAFNKVVLLVVTAIAVGLSLFQLYTAGIRTPNLFYQRSIHLAFILTLAFLLFPAFGKGRKRGVVGWCIDGVFIAASIFSGFYLSYFLDDIINRAGFWTRADIVAGIIATIALLEASRRVIGITITIIGMVFIVYAMAGSRGTLPWLGQWLPGILEHRGYTIDRIVAQLYLGQEGIFGIPLGVAATFVFIFVLFGAFLEVTGAGKFFIDIAYASAGRQRGGPAKAAVVASAFMGSISGSAIANVVTSGAFTIPLMKRLGYKPEEAAGVEAAASTGGQIMPPIMGAGAFLIAEYTRMPYLNIVRLSILPAIMYFATVYLFVDIIAAKRGMRGMHPDDLPQMRKVMAGGWHFLIPLVLLVVLLFRSISPARVGFWAVVSVLIVSALRFAVEFVLSRQKKDTSTDDNKVSAAELPKLALVNVANALETGARNAIPVSVACAVAGIVVGIVGLTGLGLKFSSMMLSFSGGNIVLALILVVIASLILGMGLPVTASYIVLIVLTGPALTEQFGIPLIIAHLLVFWYSQDSNVTPPVALAAFAGAGIAGADPMKTGFIAWKFAKGLYLIPLFMVFNPEIIVGGAPLVVIWNVLTAFAALGAFAALLEGYLFTNLRWVSRLLAGAGTLAIFYPSFQVELLGFLCIIATLVLNFMRMQREQPSVDGMSPVEA
ncbi:MAG: TRAP transporter permease [Deinococcota bacterium]